MADDDTMTAEQASSELQRLINGFRISQAIHVAAVLGVADQIARGVCRSDEIAAAVGAHPRALYRLLRALAGVGVLREDEGQRFSLKAMGECLRSDADPSVRPWATYVGQAYRWQTWGHLLHSVKTGENAFRALFGMDGWAYRQAHPEQDAIFNAAMTGNSRRVNRAIVAAYDFSCLPRVIDIGGGQGSFLAAILTANPAVRGVLFDLPHVVATAAPVLEAAGVARRCEVVGGDMFASVPEGGAAHVMKFVIHDWGDADSIRILRSCRRAIPPDGTLLVIERLVGPPNEDHGGKLSDLNMLVGPGGQERTLEEFATLLHAAGFRLTDVVRTTAPATVIVGAPA